MTKFLVAKITKSIIDTLERQQQIRDTEIKGFGARRRTAGDTASRVPTSPANRCNERLHAQDRDHPFDVVSQNAEAHLCFHAIQTSRKEVRVAHP